MNDQALPRTILNGLFWSFTGGPFSSSEVFSEEVRQYQIDIADKDSWTPDAVVLPVPGVLIHYLRGSDLEGTVELSSSNGRMFTALDLLFGIHNAVVDTLSGVDHQFFEGLRLNSTTPGGSPPLYILNLGS